MFVIRTPILVSLWLLAIVFGATVCPAQQARPTSRPSVAPQPRNIAIKKPVTATSQSPQHPAANAVDGVITRKSKWEAGTTRPPHILEVDFKKYFAVAEIRVHSGITDAEKRPDETAQAAGFWSLKNFKLQYWDDANWSDLPKSELHENRLTTASFRYDTPVVTHKIRLVCDDGEAVNVMEIEAFGAEAPGMPAPPSVTSDLAKEAAATGPRRATITVSDKVVGKTMKYVGYNQGYFLPGSNVAGWLEYSNVNSIRLWASLNAFAPASAVQTDAPPQSVAEFDKRKAQLRRSPEKNAFLRWDQLTPLYDKHDTSSTNAMVFNYALAECKRLGLDVVLQAGSTDFEDTWGSRWKQWQRYYALVFYAAKAGDVEMFAMQNEPNHRNSGPMKLDVWILGMQVVSDAVQCAIEDVNRIYSKKLKPKFVGPVTAGYNTEWWAAIAKAIRTNYRGETVERDLLQVFSTHSYNSPAAGYESRVSAIRKVITDNHPLGQPLPIAYTEIGRWMNAYLIDKEETMDSPSLFTEWAGIYANNMNNGAHGMWAFKFANTVSGPYPRGIKSGHHFTWQGRRIVEDAYENLALNKPTSTSKSDTSPKVITDGDKSDASAWVSDAGDDEKWVEINLGGGKALGGAVVYTGSAGGVYTAPDRIKNFKLQAYANGAWADIPGAAEKDCKYAQVFSEFKKPVTTDRVRFVSTDPGPLKVREIKLFTAGDGPSNEQNFDVSGIQRTGEVVRLFAKGFRDERPLLETKSSAQDNALDSYTSYDAASGNYFTWLVNRGLAPCELTIKLGGLDVSPGATATAETVSGEYNGEVTAAIDVPAARSFPLTLSPQSVTLVTIPKGKTARKTIAASADATVIGGGSRQPTSGDAEQLFVRLDASQPANNKVAYIQFDVPKDVAKNARRSVLRVSGKSTGGKDPFRFHVYAIPAATWDQRSLKWSNAPLLDANEALIREVGRKAFVAGELAFDETQREHMLDVSALVRKRAGDGITFVLVRETRQLGDDVDKGREVIVESSESPSKPSLDIWIDGN